MSTQPIDEELSNFALGQTFTEAEQDWCESTFEALRLEQRDEYLSAFLSLDCIRAMELQSVTAHAIQRDFQSAARWHSFRASTADPASKQRRLQLAEKYKLLSSNLAKILSESLN
jgi:hypothetical protein